LKNFLEGTPEYRNNTTKPYIAVRDKEFFKIEHGTFTCTGGIFKLQE
jgi:hypothetical protein